MNLPTMYAVNPERDQSDLLRDIIHLSIAGAATTDTPLNIQGLEGAQCCLFEKIYGLASDALDIAETQEREATSDA